MHYRWWRNGALAFMFVYVCVGLYTQADSSEVYPFFSWSLFSTIPNEHVSYTIQVEQAGGVRYNPPLSFVQAGFLVKQVGLAPSDYLPVISRLGQAIQHHQASDIGPLRANLEKIFPSGAYRYKLLEVHYDPIAFWKAGTYTKMILVAELQGTH